ncbi:LamG-like jellyroll fold domain-containing protein [Naasia aerilata]|uniref:PKD domain-containing protein n=1 Tax=Naasia aerilata TaxID=1162966 RepID=A0ABM8GCT8_9MICO|nr:LamG-like jellyroll fold domain-containing protein [Naasia aerilata]BDZ46065.1 hypothetical protein GCM10025866_19740 [Naasia aerilata]
MTAPDTFSLELWFNTTSTAGGKLIGFGNAATGASSTYDRHIWLDNAGKLNFGVYTGASNTITSTSAYNDGQWHHVVATLSSGGMLLYADSVRVGANAGVTTGQGNTGYWRVGGDSTWGGAQYVTAKIDEVAIYGAALSSTQIKRHYASATGVPAATFTSTMSGLAGTFDGTGSVDYDGSIAGWSWNFGDGTAAGTGATVSHTYASPAATP